MRLIDADDAIKRSKNDRLAWVYDLTDLEEFLKDVPTVDAVPVVRCKDCVSKAERNCVKGIIYCNLLDISMNANNFCSYGKPKK